MVKRVESVELPGSPAEVLQQVLHALSEFGANNIAVDQNGMSVSATTGMSWRSYGEGILITLAERGATTEVTVESRPRLKTTLFDLGKNGENVRRIAAAIKKVQHAHAAGLAAPLNPTFAALQKAEGRITVATLFHEHAQVVNAPRQFVQEYLLDIANWMKIAETVSIPLVSADGVWWEGTPWAPGSVLAMRSKAAGIGLTQRTTVLATEPGELFRFSTHSRLAGQTTISSYSLKSISEMQTEATGRTFIAGNSDMAKKIAKKIMSNSSLVQTAAQKLARAIEAAWSETQEVTLPSKQAEQEQ